MTVLRPHPVLLSPAWSDRWDIVLPCVLPSFLLVMVLTLPLPSRVVWLIFSTPWKIHAQSFGKSKKKKRWNKCCSNWSRVICSALQNVALGKLPFNIINETNGVPFFLIPFSSTVIEWSGDCEVKPGTSGSISMESQFFKTWWMPLGIAHFTARISVQRCTLSNSTQLSHYVVL